MFTGIVRKKSEVVEMGGIWNTGRIFAICDGKGILSRIGKLYMLLA